MSRDSTNYSVQRNNPLRKAFNDFKNLTKLERQIDQYESYILSDHGVREQQIATHRNNQLRQEPKFRHPQTCQNCFRRNSARNHSNTIQSISFTNVHRDDIQNRSVSKTFSLSNVTSQTIVLCEQYSTVLSSDHSDRDNDKNKWPAFIWSFLSNEDCLRIYGGNKLWAFIPTEWRPWWCNSLKYHLPVPYFDISVDSPASCFVDRTCEINDFDSDINSMDLVQLKKNLQQISLANHLVSMGVL